MYYPILRGKQYELIALRELLLNHQLSRHITPIIEPTRASSTFKSVLQAFNEAERDLAVIQNSSVVEYQPFDDEEVSQMKAGEHFIPAQLIHTSADLDALGTFANPKIMGIITKADNPDIDLADPTWQRAIEVIDVGQRLLRRSTGKRVELREAFKPKKRNSDYQDDQDEFFSEDHQYFALDGYAGFSDYSVIDSEYKENGFAPYAVAIHIVYLDDESQLRICHFVSDSNDDYNDPAKKFSEALTHLCKWYKSAHIAGSPNDTQALRTFVAMHGQGVYSGLGIIKKLSIQHHLEVVGKYLDGGE